MSANGMSGEVLHWAAALIPEPHVLAGSPVRLIPVDPRAHAQSLFVTAHTDEDPTLWDYLSVGSFANEDDFTAWLVTCDR